jgi:hypothetical protein
MALVEAEKRNIEKHGFTNWYDWNVANWGTKWDVNNDGNTVSVDEGATGVEIYFNTAWSPPLGFYEHMEGLGFGVQALYYEMGMAFCGAWEDGCDSYYDITGDSNWVVKNIPSDIDEAFNISGSMEEWEAEEAAETEEDTDDVE